MNKKIPALVLQLPLVLIVIISFFASIYATIKKIGGVSYMTPIILAIIIAAYFYGRYLETKSRSFY